MAGGWVEVGQAKGGTASSTGLGKGKTDEDIVVQANRMWLVSGTTFTLNFLRKLMPKMGPATPACKKLEVKVCLEIGQFFGLIPKRGRVVICSFKKSAMAGVCSERDNAQSCSGVHQESVISQFICKENQSSIGREMHCCGSGLCWNGRQTRKDSTAL
jgi:hypothetical protein